MLKKFLFRTDEVPDTVKKDLRRYEYSDKIMA